MKKYIRVGLIFVILAILASSATIVTADETECILPWVTYTKGPNLTTRSVGGKLDAYYLYDLNGVEIGVENVCTGTVPIDSTFKGAQLYSLYDACLLFHPEEYCDDNPDTFHVDNTQSNLTFTMVNPDDWKITYEADTWSVDVDEVFNFVWIRTHIYP